ncbi:hypothetical protein, partial [Burkholderia cenocepacia]|uniref:hypothetical protein n=1 Tax=Burkholderia cenocepacia TaxID=95486 RepID=UPI002AB20DE5
QEDIPSCKLLGGTISTVETATVRAVFVASTRCRSDTILRRSTAEAAILTFPVAPQFLPRYAGPLSSSMRSR